jgi:hypothetical protein
MNLARIVEQETPLTKLERLETIIEKGKTTFIEVGTALRQIAEGKLYVERGYSTFAQYCIEWHGFTRKTGYSYIRAAMVSAVIANVTPTLHGKPSFTQCVALSELPPEQQIEVAKTMDFGSATVKKVREEVKRIRKISEPAKPKRSQEERDQQEVRDVEQILRQVVGRRLPALRRADVVEFKIDITAPQPKVTVIRPTTVGVRSTARPPTTLHVVRDDGDKD